ncbi:MAG: NAD(P)H-binding protein [Acidimicrobiia bacterium]|nr:NAD(P)H-binding protein [Acidimicrobiia bacterium]
MRVIVFGATGRTGRHVLRLALDRGYEVTAFGRSAER